MTKKEHRQKLIDTFVNAIYLYDDKVVITFNYKEGSKIVDFTDLNTAVAGSDLECSGAPTKIPHLSTKTNVGFLNEAALLG